MDFRGKLRNSVTAKWLLLLVALVFALLLCEIGVRIVRLAPPVHAIWLDDQDAIYVRSTNAILSHVLRPGGTLEHVNGDATVNAHGFRDRERTLAKPEGTRRIVVLGDSVVEGITYLPDDRTITRQWENLYPDGRTEVLNLGTAGYCTLAEVELLETRGLRFQPDVVVLVFVLNDFQNFNPEHTVNGGVIPRPEWSKHLFLDSQLFRLLSLRFNWFEFATEGDPLRWNRRAIGENNVVRGLERLRQLADRHGFRVLVAAWPEFHNAQIFDSRVMPDQSGELVIERLARMNSLPFVRLSTAFNEHWRTLGDNVQPRTHYTANGDLMHPNPAGARVAAEVLHTVVERHGIAPPPYPRRPDDLAAIAVARSLGANLGESNHSMPRRRVRALLRQGRADEAEAYLRERLTADPDDAYANGALGGILSDAGRFEESVPFIRRSAELQPLNPNNWVSLSISHASASNHTAAVAVLREALQHVPDSASLHFNLGYLEMVRDNLDVALRHLRRAVEIDPQFPDAAFILERVENAVPNAPPAKTGN